jgi:REP element-mobilizing transposase RayT
LLFGKITGGKIVLNEFGKIAENEWLTTEQIRNNIKIDQYIVMPNHLHGIINIIEKDHSKGTMQSRAILSKGVRANSNSPQRTSFKSPSEAIRAIIRGYKSKVTKKINLLRESPGLAVWQRNYYERVIRDEPELNRIRKYIIENPLKWETDEYY